MRRRVLRVYVQPPVGIESDEDVILYIGSTVGQLYAK